MGDEKTVTTAESGQCVIFMDCVVGDERPVCHYYGLCGGR